MKQIIITIIKFIGFFLGWAILTSVLPLSSSENPAIWRLWAEIMPLLAMIAFTFIFWLIEKKTVRLYLFDNPVRGVVIGTVTGTIWLAIPVLVMFMARIMHFLWNGIGALVLGGVSLADDYPNLYITAFTGNDILSGGSCKIEGSIIVLFVNIILIAFFGYLKNKQGQSNGID